MASPVGSSALPSAELSSLAPASVPISRVSSANSATSSEAMSTASSSTSTAESNATATTATPPTTSPPPSSSLMGAGAGAPHQHSTARPPMRQHKHSHSMQGQSASSSASATSSRHSRKHSAAPRTGNGNGYGFPSPTDHNSLSASTSTTHRKAQSPPSPLSQSQRELPSSTRPRFHSKLSSGVREASVSFHPSAEASHASSRSTSNEPLDAKVVLLGDQGVGKTSIIHRYIHDNFDTNTQSTIGASFMAKKLVVDECVVKLQLWDTAGQERFRSMAPLYYRGALAAILVYDITSMRSFQGIKAWMDEILRREGRHTIIMVVGAKADLPHHLREVDLEFAQQTVAEWSWALEHPNEPREEGSSETMATLDEEPIQRAPPSPSDAYFQVRQHQQQRRERSRSKTPNASLNATPALSRASSTRGGESLSLGMSRSRTSPALDSPSGIEAISAPVPGSLVRSGSSLSFAFNGLGLGRGAQRDASATKASATALEAESDRQAFERRNERKQIMRDACRVQVSEVSAKESWGIEECFLGMARQLLEARAQHSRVLRTKDSIIIDSAKGPEVVSTAGWTCCG